MLVQVYLFAPSALMDGLVALNPFQQYFSHIRMMRM